jgi:ketosteroid isomerase-like protein
MKDDADIISQRRHEHIEAFNRRDIAAMSRTVTEDSIAMPPNQPPLTGRDSLEAWWAEGFEAAQSKFSHVAQELLLDQSWAFDRFEWRMETRSSSGQYHTDNGNCVWLWEKQHDGSWLLARSIWNSVNQSPGVWSGSRQ